MKQSRVYDLPTRFFHWSFALLFGGAFLVAKIFEDESTVFPLHMMLGLTLGLTVILRSVWGLVGSRFARFSSFALRPSALVEYSRNLLMRRTDRTLGHNPASSWAALVMMILALSLVFSGLQILQGPQKEFFEEVHEVVGYAFLLVAISHVAGIAIHMIRHRDGIAFSMIHGKKADMEGGMGIDRNHTAVAAFFLLSLVGFGLYLNAHYDRRTLHLNLFGNDLTLGELKNAEKAPEKHDD